MSNPPAACVASPCVSICRMHEPSGWCEGCLRTLDEIAGWGSLDDPARRVVLQRLGPRRVAWRALRAAARAGPAGGPTSVAGPGAGLEGAA